MFTGGPDVRRGGTVLWSKMYHDTVVFHCTEKKALDHACRSFFCSYQHSACNCNPMLFVLM